MNCQPAHARLCQDLIPFNKAPGIDDAVGYERIILDEFFCSFPMGKKVRLADKAGEQPTELCAPAPLPQERYVWAT